MKKKRSNRRHNGSDEGVKWLGSCEDEKVGAMAGGQNDGRVATFLAMGNPSPSKSVWFADIPLWNQRQALWIQLGAQIDQWTMRCYNSFPSFVGFRMTTSEILTECSSLYYRLCLHGADCLARG